MKKILLLLVACAALASCSITNSYVKTSSINSPILTTTIASLKVADAPITYTYTPSYYESKHSSFNMILENAKYLALKQYGGDVLVQVSYKVNGRGLGKMINRVNDITITGYPATYVDFRTPNDEDRENIRTYNSLGSTKHTENFISIRRRDK